MENSKALSAHESYSLLHILIIFGLLAIFIVSNLYIMIPILDDVANTYSVATTEASLSISIFTFFYACGLIFFGSICERFGLKETICSGLLLLIFLMVACFFVNDFLFFILMRGIQGVAAASFAPVSFIFVLHVLKQEHHGIAIGVINTGFLSAGVIGQLLSSSINLLFPWQAIFLSLALMYSAIYIYALRKLPKPKKAIKPKSFRFIINTIFTLPFQKNMRKMYFITFTILLSFVAYYTALENFFSQHLQLSAQDALLIRGFGLIGLLVTFFFSKISKKIGFEKTIILGLCLQLLGLFLSASSSVSIITIGSIVFVTGISLVIPSVIQLIGIKAGKNRSFAISLYSFILLLGASVGSTIIFISSYYTQLLILATLLLISLALIFIENSYENQ